MANAFAPSGNRWGQVNFHGQDKLPGNYDLWPLIDRGRIKCSLAN